MRLDAPNVLWNSCSTCNAEPLEDCKDVMPGLSHSTRLIERLMMAQNSAPDILTEHRGSLALGRLSNHYGV